MRQRLHFLCFLLVVIVIISSGCGYDARELDHRSMIIGMAVDKPEESEDITVSFQLPVLTGSLEKNPGQKDFDTVTSSARTIMEAIEDLEALTPRALFFGHLKVVVISDKIAKEDIGEILDVLDRHPQISNQIFLLIVENDKAKDFVAKKSPFITLPSLYVSTFFEAEQKMSRTKDVKLFEYIRDSLGISSATYVPLGRLEKEEIKIQDFAIMKNHKMIGMLRDEDAGCARLFKEQKISDKRFTVELEVPGEEKILVNLTRMDLKQKMRYKKTNPVEIDLEISGQGNIRGKNTMEYIDFFPEFINELEKKTNEELEKEFNQVITQMQKLNAEPFLFGQTIFATNPKYFDTLAWNNTGWAEAKVNISVDFKVRNTGTKGMFDKKKIGK